MLITCRKEFSHAGSQTILEDWLSQLFAVLCPEKKLPDRNSPSGRDASGHPSHELFEPRYMDYIKQQCTSLRLYNVDVFRFLRLFDGQYSWSGTGHHVVREACEIVH